MQVCKIKVKDFDLNPYKPWVEYMHNKYDFLYNV